MARYQQCEGLILVGGKSSRMGREKANLAIGGKLLVERAVDLLRPLVAPIRLSGGEKAGLPGGVVAISDRWPEAGPLGGIASGLVAAEKLWCFVLACDMPFVTPEWVEWLIARAESSQSEAVVPQTSRGAEPLCAIYRTTCAQTLAAALDSGIRKVTDGLAKLNVEFLKEDDWKEFSPDGMLFRSLNTWEEYLNAKARLES